MIELPHRHERARVLYRAETAGDLAAALREAVERGADLAGVDLSSADLAGARLASAKLAGADLAGAYLRAADLSGADLTGARLARAYLRGADLSSANLSGADLSSANLSSAHLVDADLRGARLAGTDLGGARLQGALGLAAERVNDLLILLDQVGAVRAYKLVDAGGEDRTEPGVVHAVGATREGPIATGIRVATLAACLRDWRPGDRVLLVEFGAQDITAPPDDRGELRVARCQVVAEKPIDPVALGLLGPEEPW